VVGLLSGWEVGVWGSLFFFWGGGVSGIVLFFCLKVCFLVVFLRCVLGLGSVIFCVVVCVVLNSSSPMKSPILSWDFHMEASHDCCFLGLSPVFFPSQLDFLTYLRFSLSTVHTRPSF